MQRVAGGRGADLSPRPLFLCCGYAQLIHGRAETDQDRIVNLRFSGRRGHTLCLSFAHSVVSSVKPYNLDSTSMQFRLNLQGQGIRGGAHERIQYTDVEAKKATNRNDEAEGAQTEIHRSFANEGAEPTGPRPCRFSAAAASHVRGQPLPVAIPNRSARPRLTTCAIHQASRRHTRRNSLS